MEPATKVSDVLHVLYAIDAHAERVRLEDSGAWIRGTLRIDGVARDELQELSGARGAKPFVKVRRVGAGKTPQSSDCVDIEGARVTLEVRTADRDATPDEIERLDQHGAQSAIIPVGEAQRG